MVNIVTVEVVKFYEASENKDCAKIKLNYVSDIISPTASEKIEMLCNEILHNDLFCDMAAYSFLERKPLLSIALILNNAGNDLVVIFEGILRAAICNINNYENKMSEILTIIDTDIKQGILY
jgi:hypothetical protein